MTELLLDMTLPDKLRLDLGDLEVGLRRRRFPRKNSNMGGLSLNSFFILHKSLQEKTK